MIKRVHPAFFLFNLGIGVQAQINAGDVPTGASTFDPGISITLNTAFTTDSSGIDVDCDGAPDIMAILIKNEPAIDAPNGAIFHLLAPGLELCMDLAASNSRPRYYSFGQPLDCTGSFDWQSDPVNVLGNIGTFTQVGPSIVDSLYLAYRNGAQVGWILLSFNIEGTFTTPVWLTIHRVLRPCATSLSEAGTVSPVVLFPNPANAMTIQLECEDALLGIDLLDAIGRPIGHVDGNVRTITAPAVAGAYLVRALHENGRITVLPVVKY